MSGVRGYGFAAALIASAAILLATALGAREATSSVSVWLGSLQRGLRSFR